jgi:hypothetical protein
MPSRFLTREKVRAAQEEVFTDKVVFDGVIVILFADVPTNVVKFVFHFHLLFFCNTL